MRQVLRLGGINLGPQNTIPALPIDALDIAFGNVPNLEYLGTPEYYDETKGIKNLARRSSWQEMSNPTTPTASINGVPAWEMTGADPLAFRDIPVVSNPAAWSFWAMVGYIDPADTGRAHAIFDRTDDFDGNSNFAGLRLGVSNVNGAATIWENQGQLVSGDATSARRRLTFIPPDPFSTTPAFLMFTFSVQRGLAILYNGALGATNPSDRRPLSQDGALIQSMRYTRGRFGIAGFCASDLSSPENTAYRRGIENYVMGLYSIG